MKKFFESNKGIIAIVLIFVSVISILVFTNVQATKDLYVSLQNDINNNLWQNAKEKVEKLGDYKDCKILAPTIYFNYYLQVGDEQFVNKNYDSALENYKKSKQYKSSDKDIDKKIKNAEVQIEKERIKAEQERLRAERKRQIEEQKEKQRRKVELSELTRMVKRAFAYTDFLDCGDNSSTGFNFYVYPECWSQLTYEEKQNIFNSCARYVELKLNVSSSHAYRYTRIIDVYTRSVLWYGI